MTKTNNHSNIMPWIVCSIASLYVLYQFLLQSSTSVMIPCLEHAFNIDIVGVGLIYSSFFYTYTVLQIPAGLLVDKIGPRKVLNISIISCTVAVFIFALAPSLRVAELSRMMMGIVASPSVAAGLYLIARWFPPQLFALVAGLMEMLGMIGGAIGEKLLSVCVASPLGWRNTMMLAGSLGIALAVLAFFTIYDRPNHTNTKAKEHNDSVARAPVKESLKQVLAKPQAWLNGLYAGFMFALISGFAGQWSVPFLEQVYDANVVTAGGMSAIVFLGAAVGAPFFGWLSGVMGKRRPVMIFTSFISIFVVCVILYVPHLTMLAMDLWLFALGFFSGSYVVPFAVVREITPLKAQGTAMGFTNMICIIVGAPIVAPLTTLLLRLFWSGKVVGGIAIYSATDYRIALSSLPVCMLLALVTVFFIKETYCRPQFNEEL